MKFERRRAIFGAMFHSAESSDRVYRPKQKSLEKFARGPHVVSDARVCATESAIAELLAPRDFPCIAAIQSFRKDDYEVGFYGRIGRGEFWRELRSDLLAFLAHQRKTRSTELSFWAVFEPENFAEADFEQALWSELSFMTSSEECATDWAPGETTNPDDPNFCFSLSGTSIFVVGLHSQSSRRGRRFPFPTLIFNSFEQFEELKEKGRYDAMVKVNRQRDELFDGQVNPMALAHGEVWESIQFSGRNNSSDWKCPFRFLHRAEKP